MKTRLSLTLDPKVTHRAKRYARARNQSLSAVVEDLLNEVSMGEEPSHAPSKATFSQRWAAQLQPAERDDARYRRLAAKYNLP